MSYDNDCNCNWNNNCAWENDNCHEDDNILDNNCSIYGEIELNENYRWDDNFKWDNDYKDELEFRWDSNFEDNSEEYNWNEDHALEDNQEANEGNYLDEELDNEEDNEEEYIEENMEEYSVSEPLHENDEVEGVDEEETEIFQEQIELQDPPRLASAGLREICVIPMHNILKQLSDLGIGDIEIGTERQGTIFNARIISIEDSLVKIETPFIRSLIPIHQIVGICTRSLPKIDLLPEPDIPRQGDCECCERHLREYCSSRIGRRYTINTIAKDEVFSSISGTITRIGEGVLVVDDTVAIIICKIISIEKSLRRGNEIL